LSLTVLYNELWGTSSIYYIHLCFESSLVRERWIFGFEIHVVGWLKWDEAWGRTENLINTSPYINYRAGNVDTCHAALDVTLIDAKAKNLSCINDWLWKIPSLRKRYREYISILIGSIMQHLTLWQEEDTYSPPRTLASLHNLSKKQRVKPNRQTIPLFRVLKAGSF
jgi:hypothetical protein